MAKLRIFNVSGRVLMSETKDGPVRIQINGTLDLDSPMKIGEKMKQQLDTGLLKQRVLDQPPHPAPKSIEEPKPKKKKAKGTKKDPIPAPPADDTGDDGPGDENNPYEGLKGDELVKAVMQEMIDGDDNLGKDGKPNQPVLEGKLQEINPKMTVSAKRRDRLFDQIKGADGGEE